MKKHITIIRTAPYSYQLPGMNLYDSFNAVATQARDISIDSKQSDAYALRLKNQLKKTNTVFCSPRKRSKETAQLFVNQPQVLNELVEIGFSMEEFISETDFYDALGQPQVRQARIAFVRGLITSSLRETYQEVLQRIDTLIELLQESQSQRIVLFSHGFFMKVIEAYIRDPAIKNEPTRLLQYFNGETETFPFGEGFSFHLTASHAKFDTYIQQESM